MAPRKRKAKMTNGPKLIVVHDVQRENALVASLGDLLGIIDRVGGFMKPEDQQLLRNARSVHGGA